MTQTTNAHDDTNEPAAITLTLTPKEAEAISDLIEDEAFCTQGTDAQPAFWLALFTKIKEARGDTLPRDHFPTLIHTEEGTPYLTDRRHTPAPIACPLCGETLPNHTEACPSEANLHARAYA